MIPGEGANFTMICTHPVSVRELKLDQEQIAALKKIVTDLRKEPVFFPENRDNIDQQRTKYLQQQNDRRKQIREADKATEKLLSDEQRKRAKQLLFQYNLQTRRVDAALRSIGETVLDKERQQLEAELSTIPVVVAAKFAEVNYKLVARAVDEGTPETPSIKLMGEMFRFIDRNPGPVDMERHKLDGKGSRPLRSSRRERR